MAAVFCLFLLLASAAFAQTAPVVGADPVGQVLNGAWAGKYYGGASVAYDERGVRLGVTADRDRDMTTLSISLPAPIGQ